LASVHTYSEAELVELLKQRDRNAFNYLYEHYSGALLHQVNAIVTDETLAADVLQEVFLNIFRKFESYDASRSRLYTWMLNIARNAAIDMVRSKGFRQTRQNRGIDDSVYNSATGSVSTQTDHIGLSKNISALKQDLRQVIELAYYSGYTQEEISELLSIPLGTVKTRIRTGLKQLRELMQ
jgi:RNA polymerase sigma-70 factor (ECF subfamily)